MILGIEFTTKDLVLAVAPLVIGVILGGIIGWLVSQHFARQSSRELQSLRAQNHALRDELGILTRALEASGHFKLNRDADGNIIGVVHEVTATIQGTSHASASSLVTTAEPQRPWWRRWWHR